MASSEVIVIFFPPKMFKDSVFLALALDLEYLFFTLQRKLVGCAKNQANTLEETANC